MLWWVPRGQHVLCQSVVVLCHAHESYLHIMKVYFSAIHLDDLTSNLGFAPGTFKRSRWRLQQGGWSQ